jgi:hypothetical protein
LLKVIDFFADFPQELDLELRKSFVVNLAEGSKMGVIHVVWVG